MEFIFNHIKENRYKMFRWKLIQKILPNDLLLCKWKIKPNPFCYFCGQEDNYEHFFLKCSFNKKFLNEIKSLMKKLGYNKDMLSMKNIAIGYKISDKEYYDINTLLTLISYTIYKGYYVSEQRKNIINLNSIFKNLLLMHMSILHMQKSFISPVFFKTCKFFAWEPDFP